jgi:hypothetical protein
MVISGRHLGPSQEGYKSGRAGSDSRKLLSNYTEIFVTQFENVAMPIRKPGEYFCRLRLARNLPKDRRIALERQFFRLACLRSLSYASDTLVDLSLGHKKPVSARAKNYFSKYDGRA